jgi:DNA polymerase alpha-associated DNA helicase A
MRDRMNGVMEKMAKMSEGEMSVFVRVLFGQASPSSVGRDLSRDSGWKDIEWVDPTLNESQKDAIRFALASNEIALIHGPPGVSCYVWKTSWIDTA